MYYYYYFFNFFSFVVTFIRSTKRDGSFLYTVWFVDCGYNIDGVSFLQVADSSGVAVDPVKDKLLFPPLR